MVLPQLGDRLVDAKTAEKMIQETVSNLQGLVRFILKVVLTMIMEQA